MSDDAKLVERSPWWILVIVIGLAAVEPLTHLWLRYGLVGDFAHTGLHIGDTPFFLTAMQIFENNFHSPYGLCVADAQSISYFTLPHHWVYAALGFIGGLVGSPHFLTLGFANAFFGALYLWLAYRFMRCVTTPKIANRAFLLFTLGGGLAGLLYVLSGLVGAHASLNFESWFHRYARYELIEGPFLSPLIVMPRLYYTLPLALAFASLVKFINAARADKSGPGLLAIVAILATTYLNARVGALFFLVALSYIVSNTRMTHAAKFRFLLCYGIPVLAATTLVYFQLNANPSAAENVNLLLRRAAWFGAVLSAVFWFLLPVGVALRHLFPSLSPLARIVCAAAVGYLVAFATLYFAHQLYWRNLGSGGDTAAAIAISDWSILGAVVGAIIAFYRKPSPDSAGQPDELAWLAVWLLPLFALSIAAFGQGWFLRLMPERILIVLGVPLALLASEGIERLRPYYPRFARAVLAVIVVSGLLSNGVAALCFQGPLGQDNPDASFDWAHNEVMLRDDAVLIRRLPAGTYLAPASLPPIFGDIIVHNTVGAQTVFGQPTLEFSGVNMLETIQEVQQFFSVDADEDFRKRLVQMWCVEFLYCPATRPADTAVIEQFQKTSWLEEVDREGDALLFRVRDLEDGD